jgi:hypothetical protein
MEEFDTRRYIIDNIGINDEDNNILPWNSNQIIAGKVNDEINDEANNADEIDVEVSSLLMLNSIDDIMRNIRPKQTYQYLMLDSANAVFSPDRSTMQWLINDGNPIARSNYINLSRPLKNIIAMRLGRVSWSSMDQTNTNILTNNHIGLGFSEFASQSLIFPSGPRLHFIQYDYDLIHTGNTITTSSFFENRGWFRFRKPFTKLDTLTLSVWNLGNVTPIIMPDYYVSINAMQVCYAFTFEGPNLFYIVTNDLHLFPIIYPTFHGLPDYTQPLSVLGEQFQYSGFTTNDPVADAVVIAQYNSQHTITFTQVNSVYVIDTPINLVGTHLNIFQRVPITITFLYKPRMIAALELLIED